MLALLLALALGGGPARAVVFTGAPAVGSVANNFKYLGCASEIPGRALQGSSYSSDEMTIESCQAYCINKKFPLAGVEYGRECYCGKWLVTPSGYVQQSTCDMPCLGERSQFCGGNSRISVFNATKFVGPRPPPTVAGQPGWTYESCFMEPLYDRALTTLVRADDRMTIPMCTATCQEAGYSYAGLEYGRECWCGATRSADLEDASDPNCAMQCDMECGGDADTICGGRGAITVYKKNAGVGKRTDSATGRNDFGHGPVGVDVGGPRNHRRSHESRRVNGV